MAEEKKGVIIYADYINTFEELDDDEAGRLIKHFFRYVNDLNPEPPDKLTKIAFEPIKQQLKRDLEKWSNTREKRSRAGQISASKRAEQALTKDQQDSTNSTNVQQDSTNSTVICNSNSNSNSNSNELIVKGRKAFRPPTVEEVFEYCQERKNAVDPEKFVDYYTSNGWKVGKNALKDWKAAVRTWEKSNFNNQNQSNATTRTEKNLDALRKF